MIVLSYDVDTTDAAGAKRLRKVAKICEAKGCRVQNAVFELLVDPAQLTLSLIHISRRRVRRLSSRCRPMSGALARSRTKVPLPRRTST